MSFYGFDQCDKTKLTDDFNILQQMRREETDEGSVVLLAGIDKTFIYF